ncbi:hypothetical protein LAV82_22975 [Bacillus sp. ILBB4]|nr:hypothetical protein [Bacillus sp. ILBB4]
MDIVSYGIGNKSAKEEANLRKDILGTGVEGAHPHVRARIDSLEEAIENVNSLANKLIINDAVNIMKAHAKLNAIANTTKYKMHNMIFDDLLDLSGIDTSKSSGYTHDTVNGSLKNGSIVTKEEITDVIPSKVVLNVDESFQTSNITGKYYISRDNGITWEQIIPNSLFYFTDFISPQNKKLRLKAELPTGTTLLNYALTWA